MSANAALKDARKALDAKDWASALKYAQQALELDKNNYNAFIFSGLAQYNLGQVQKGEQAYIQATQLEPKNIVAWQVCIGHNCHHKSDCKRFLNNLPIYANILKRVWRICIPKPTIRLSSRRPMTRSSTSWGEYSICTTQRC